MDRKVADSRNPTSEKPTADVDIVNPRIDHLIEQLRERTAELEEANRELRRIPTTARYFSPGCPMSSGHR